MRVELIGREEELRILEARLAERRLVTLVGPGGIGKTTLAREAARRAVGSGDAGRTFVDLARVDGPEGVADALASQLGFSSFRALLDSQAERSDLLVVDNCEHVVDGAATVISELLEASPAVTVLATSRSPLDLAGEAVVEVGPLALPPPGAIDPDLPSVRLFLERARDAGTTIGEDQLVAVGELCRRLDGVPLALELAAARSRSMTAAEITTRLDAQLDLLSRSRFRGTPRHRSLRSTIDWSYRMLDAEDAAVFDRLAVFAGPFTASMAHAVATPPGTREMDTIEWLDALLAALLVVAERDATTTRYRLLATLRAYAVERLRQTGAWAPTWERFADHVVALATSVLEKGRESWRSSVLGELIGLFENLAAAVKWCVAEDDDPERALLLSSVMWGVVHQARTAEIAALGRRVLERWPHPGPAWWPDAVATLSTALYLLGRTDEAAVWAERALPVASSSPFAPVTLRRVIAQIARARGELDAASASFGEAAARARDAGLVSWATELDVASTQVLTDQGRIDEALARVRAAREEAVASGSDINEVFARAVEGYALLRRDVSRASVLLEETLERAIAIGYPAGVFACRRSLVLVRLAEGRPPDAARLALALVEDFASSGDLTELRLALDSAATVLERAGRPSWADLAATAAGVPVVSLMSVVREELFPHPEHEGRPLPHREALWRARAELRELLHETPRPTPVAAPEAEEASFRRAGDFFELRFAGRSANLKASKGMEDLARLLSAPEREIHCLDLMGAAGWQSATGEVIDATARRAYEERLRDLRAEVEEAESDHDLERAERTRAELDALVDHLAASLSLGQRVREGGGDAERARSAVTQRLRAAIRRIRDAHPPLGRHLEASVQSGIFCSYRPEHPVRWAT